MRNKAICTVFQTRIHRRQHSLTHGKSTYARRAKRSKKSTLGTNPSAVAKNICGFLPPFALHEWSEDTSAEENAKRTRREKTCVRASAGEQTVHAEMRRVFIREKKGFK